MSENENTTAKDTITQRLAKLESSAELQGMAELFANMRKRSIHIKAYAPDDPSIPTGADVNIKTIHFVRHGQGFHNLTADLFLSDGKKWEPFSLLPGNPYVMPEVMDAPLTQKGRDQARALQPLLRKGTRPELVVASTLCRTLQTASIAFEGFLDGGEEGTAVPFLAHEKVREASGVHVCDQRRPMSQQRREFPWFDFSGVESENDKLFSQERRETKEEVAERIYEFMVWLSQRDEKTVGVVSHSCWLLTVFNGVVECDDYLKLWFGTGEMRSVKLLFTDMK